MARTIGPLMSFDASGKLANTVVFAKWKGRSYVRQLVTPANPETAGQLSTRSMMKFLSQAWAGLSAPEKASWQALATIGNYSPFNAFVSYNMQRWTQFQNPLREPGVTGAPSLPTFTTAPAGVGGVGQITVTWDINALNAGWGMYIFVDPADASGETKDLVQEIPNLVTLAATSAVIPRLSPGTYSIVAAPFDDLGNKLFPGVATTGIVVT